MHGLDGAILLAVNGLAGRSAVLDAAGSWVGQYGPALYAPLLLVAWFAYRLDGAKGAETETQRRRRLILAVAAGALALGLNAAIGAFWYRPRPFVAAPGLIHLLARHAADSSFPSDHASLSFAVALALFALPARPRWLAPTSLVWAVVVALGRLFLGMHWPSDILGSLAVALVSALAVRALEGVLAEPADFLARGLPPRLAGR
ncbi:MAG: phosphatase PAP2 family protein [Bacillota bacterium]|nr:phosphatase PAP2 family protein [Bacillota bacterium]